MKIFALSDLHLALSKDRPMDIYGGAWEKYMQKIQTNWNNMVATEDWVLIPGDVSWATYINDADADFQYINDLNGNKIISKGNHDYWWETKNKLTKYLKEKDFTNIKILSNDSYEILDYSICGTRGWPSEESDSNREFNDRMINRELSRLKLSLDCARKEKIIVMLHYPPMNKDGQSPFMKLMENYPVCKCIYGHVHSYFKDGPYDFIENNIEYRLVSADYLNFSPIELT